MRRVCAVWLDGIEGGWSVPLMLVLFVAVWLAILQLAYLNAGLHLDVLETWLLGRSLDWGSTKHPPLMGWIARGWTSVFPLTDWSMQLLSLVNAAFGLWLIDRIARRFVSGDRRAVVLLLAMLLPAYHLHAQRFNANAVLLSIWPLAIWCFLRSFETRSTLWSIAAGAAAALAMLGKYYSVFLIASFVFAALAHPQRLAYFTSRAPWLSALAGLAVLAPHLHWLWTHDFASFTYAANLHTGLTTQASTVHALKFVLAIAAWLLLPILVWVAIAWPSRIVREQAPDGQLILLVLIFAGTIVFPVLTAILGHTSMTGLWAVQGLFLPIVIVVSAFAIGVTRDRVVRLASGVIAATLAAVLIAPLHSVYRNVYPFKEDRNFYAELAAQLGDRWRQASDVPLEIVSGDPELAFAVSFYLPTHPMLASAIEVGIDGRRVAPSWIGKPGWVAVCVENDLVCSTLARQATENGRQPQRVTFKLHSKLFGWTGGASRFVAWMAPPRPDKAPDSAPVDDDDMMEFSASKRRADSVHP